MRKPSDLKMFVNNKIKELAEEEHNLINNDERGYAVTIEKEKKLAVVRGQLDILFIISKICEERKRY